MSRSARGVLISRVSIWTTAARDGWVHYYGVYKDLFEIYGNPSMMRGDSPLPLMCDQSMKDPFVVYQVGDAILTTQKSSSSELSTCYAQSSAI